MVTLYNKVITPEGGRHPALCTVRLGYRNTVSKARRSFGVDGTKRLGTSLMGLGLPPLFPKPEFRSRLQHSVPMSGILHPCMGLGAVFRTPLVVDLSAERECCC